MNKSHMGFDSSWGAISFVRFCRTTNIEQRDPRISLSHSQSTSLKNLSYNKNVRMKYHPYASTILGKIAKT